MAVCAARRKTRYVNDSHEHGNLNAPRTSGGEEHVAAKLNGFEKVHLPEKGLGSCVSVARWPHLRQEKYLDGRVSSFPQTFLWFGQSDF
jgi:hypothetical protein